MKERNIIANEKNNKKKKIHTGIRFYDFIWSRFSFFFDITKQLIQIVFEFILAKIKQSNVLHVWTLIFLSDKVK